MSYKTLTHHALKKSLLGTAFDGPALLKVSAPGSHCLRLSEGFRKIISHEGMRYLNDRQHDLLLTPGPVDLPEIVLTNV